MVLIFPEWKEILYCTIQYCSFPHILYKTPPPSGWDHTVHLFLDVFLTIIALLLFKDNKKEAESDLSKYMGDGGIAEYSLGWNIDMHQARPWYFKYVGSDVPIWVVVVVYWLLQKLHPCAQCMMQITYVIVQIACQSFQFWVLYKLCVAYKRSSTATRTGKLGWEGVEQGWCGWGGGEEREEMG